MPPRTTRLRRKATGLAWRMGFLVNDHIGLSTLGSEAVAAAELLDARMLVSDRDGSPGDPRGV